MDATRVAVFLIPVIGALWCLWLHHQRRHLRRVSRCLQSVVRQATTTPATRNPARAA